jgi:hypothetical protein
VSRIIAEVEMDYVIYVVSKVAKAQALLLTTPATISSGIRILRLNHEYMCTLVHTKLLFQYVINV